MADPATPVITFLVNLDIPHEKEAGVPSSYQLFGADRGRLENAQFANTRVTFLPGYLGAENRELKHGDTFQLAGMKADYYRKEIAKGNLPFLSIQSIDA